MFSRRTLSVAVLVVIVGTGVVWTPRVFLRSLRGQETSIVTVGQEVDEAKAELEKLGPPSRAFVLVAKIIRPSVVSVVTTRKVTTRPLRPFLPFDDDWPFEGPNPFKEHEKRRGRERKVSGLGSGVVVDKEGHVLTNNHVVRGADEIKVVLPDDSQYAAELVGTDPKTDLAVIKLKDCPVERIVPAKLGDSDKLQVGDWVLAVGAPFGLSQSVSAGIVSATGRTNVGIIRRPRRYKGINLSDAYENFIQTDAAINRGNSGGPLVNQKAEVIGINTAIATGTGFFQGVGFAIPSSMARRVMSQLITKGRVVRGYLGVVIRETTEEDVKTLKLARREGVVVEDVYPDTPAAKAGIEQMDVIVAIDGTPTPRMAQLRNFIARISPGAKVKLSVLREGKPRAVDVVIEEQPQEMPTTLASTVDAELGITVQTLTEGVASQLEVGGKTGVYKGEKGVLVTTVVPGSLAARAGIKPKDLIKEVANKPVTSVTEYNRARKGLDLRKGVLLLVKTGRMARLVVVK